MMSRPCPLSILKEIRLPSPKGIVHVGANAGRDEIPIYQASKAEPCVYIEPIPNVFAELQKNLEDIPNHFPCQALCSDIAGEEVIFNVASNQGRSSSMFPWGRHKQLYPHTEYVERLSIKTQKLDDIIDREFSTQQFDLLVMDTQGAELKVLMGSHKLLKHQLTYVFAEIGEDPLYEGGCTFDEVTAFLKLYGFRLKNMALNYKNWGNALYVKDLPVPIGLNLALNKPATQSSFSELSTPDEAQNAVNGIKDGTQSFRTKKELNPWWQVDLESSHSITEIRIYNCVDRDDGCVRTLNVLLSLDGANWEQVYENDEGLIFGGTAGRPLAISIAQKMSRYVKLQLSEQSYLSLDEVEVYGKN